MNVQTIHDSLVNGQKRQMVEQIDEYGLDAFWSDYADYLGNITASGWKTFDYFKAAVISYHRIKTDRR